MTLDEVNTLFTKLAEKEPDILPMVVCIANTGMRKGGISRIRLTLSSCKMDPGGS